MDENQNMEKRWHDAKHKRGRTKDHLDQSMMKNKKVDHEGSKHDEKHKRGRKKDDLDPAPACLPSSRDQAS